jgi:hypothetical protein
VLNGKTNMREGRGASREDYTIKGNLGNSMLLPKKKDQSTMSYSSTERNYEYTISISIYVLSWVASIMVAILAIPAAFDPADRNTAFAVLFARFVYQTFPASLIVTVGLAALLLVVILRPLLRESVITMGEYKAEKFASIGRELSIGRLHRGIAFLILGNTLLVLTAYAPGSYLAAGMKADYVLTRTPYYTLPFMLVAAMWTAWLIRWSPLIAFGLATLRSQHRATSAIERTVRLKRPDSAIANELASVMEAQEFDDARATALMSELSPWRQKIWRARYTKRAREVARLRELVQEQGRAIQEETGLAYDVLAMERARQAKADR